MSLFDILVVVGALIALFVLGGWFTINKFNDIESGKTNRRKHIDEDMQVKESEKEDEK